MAAGQLRPIVRSYRETGSVLTGPNRAARRAVFVDRDGVINVNRVDHVRSWSDFRFLPGSLAALALLAELDVTIVVITNQANVGRGVITTDDLQRIHDRMVKEIATSGGRIDAVVVCPHRPEEGCDCRKPQPGMLLAAARELGLDLSHSVFVGDHESDVEAARRAGCIPLLVHSGRQVGLVSRRTELTECDDLLQASRIIAETNQPIAARRADAGHAS